VNAFDDLVPRLLERLPDATSPTRGANADCPSARLSTAAAMSSSTFSADRVDFTTSGTRTPIRGGTTAGSRCPALRTCPTRFQQATDQRFRHMVLNVCALGTACPLSLAAPSQNESETGLPRHGDWAPSFKKICILHTCPDCQGRPITTGSHFPKALPCTPNPARSSGWFSSCSWA